MKFYDEVERLHLFLNEKDVKKGVQSAVNKWDINVLGDLSEKQVKQCWGININIDDANNKLTFRSQKTDEDMDIVSRKMTLPNKIKCSSKKRVHDQAVIASSLSLSESSTSESDSESDANESTNSYQLKAQLLPIQKQLAATEEKTNQAPLTPRSPPRGASPQPSTSSAKRERSVLPK